MSPMMTFHIPDDNELLAAFGKVALQHEHLNHILRMTIKTLARLTPEEALDATIYDGSRQLRDRIRKIARQRLGEGEALLKLQALLVRCKRATEKRNELVHSVWAMELDGEPQRRSSDHQWQPLPSVEEITTLSEEIQNLTILLNTARLDGFLSEALCAASLRGKSRGDFGLPIPCAFVIALFIGIPAGLCLDCACQTHRFPRVRCR